MQARGHVVLRDLDSCIPVNLRAVLGGGGRRDQAVCGGAAGIERGVQPGKGFRRERRLDVIHVEFQPGLLCDFQQGGDALVIEHPVHERFPDAHEAVAVQVVGALDIVADAVHLVFHALGLCDIDVLGHLLDRKKIVGIGRLRFRGRLSAVRCGLRGGCLSGRRRFGGSVFPALLWRHDHRRDLRDDLHHLSRVDGDGVVGEQRRGDDDGIIRPCAAQGQRAFAVEPDSQLQSVVGDGQRGLEGIQQHAELLGALPDKQVRAKALQQRMEEDGIDGHVVGQTPSLRFFGLDCGALAFGACAHAAQQQREGDPNGDKSLHVVFLSSRLDADGHQQRQSNRE